MKECECSDNPKKRCVDRCIDLAPDVDGIKADWRTHCVSCTIYHIRKQDPTRSYYTQYKQDLEILANWIKVNIEPCDLLDMDL